MATTSDNTSNYATIDSGIEYTYGKSLKSYLEEGPSEVMTTEERSFNNFAATMLKPLERKDDACVAGICKLAALVGHNLNKVVFAATIGKCLHIRRISLIEKFNTALKEISDEMVNRKDELDATLEDVNLLLPEDEKINFGKLREGTEDKCMEMKKWALKVLGTEERLERIMDLQFEMLKKSNFTGLVSQKDIDAMREDQISMFVPPCMDIDSLTRAEETTTPKNLLDETVDSPTSAEEPTQEQIKEATGRVLLKRAELRWQKEGPYSEMEEMKRKILHLRTTNLTEDEIREKVLREAHEEEWKKLGTQTEEEKDMTLRCFEPMKTREGVIRRAEFKRRVTSYPEFKRREAEREREAEMEKRERYKQIVRRTEEARKAKLEKIAESQESEEDPIGTRDSIINTIQFCSRPEDKEHTIDRINFLRNIMKPKSLIPLEDPDEEAKHEAEIKEMFHRSMVKDMEESSRKAENREHCLRALKENAALLSALPPTEADKEIFIAMKKKLIEDPPKFSDEESDLEEEADEEQEDMCTPEALINPLTID